MFKRIGFGAAWLLAVGAGTGVMLNYQSAAGRVGETPQHWPSGALISPEHGRATLLMFAHPKCPCTRASMGELNRLLTQSRGEVAAHVLFLQPSELSDDWTRTDLWRSAAAIPGVTVHEDRDGRQASRFGAATSGFVVLYDAQGELLFKGGITAGRGHSGDNAGVDAIVSLLAGGSASLGQSPVYGCSLGCAFGTAQEGGMACTK